MHDVQGTNLPVSILLLDFYLCKASEAKNDTQIKYQGDNLKLFSLVAELLYFTSNSMEGVEFSTQNKG